MSRTTSCLHCPGSHTGERPCLGTATTKAGSWLLIEHPGPWPERVEQLTRPGPVADAVRNALRLGVRPQLIRRTGRRRAIPPMQVFVGHSLPEHGEVWLEGRELADPAELAALDMTMLAAGRPPGFGDPVTAPLLLVCTHGRRNVCCARAGAPLARAVHARFGDAVWETTHVGGDRYAANMVCLPHGIYYGSLSPAEAVTAADAYLRGEVVLDRLRGRAGRAEAAQAAEHFAREHCGEFRLDAVHVRSTVRVADAIHESVVDVGPDRYRIGVEHLESGAGCGAECTDPADTFRVTRITLLNRAALV